MVFLSIVSIALICVVISYFVWYYHYRLPFIKAANALPGPETYPLIGNARYFLQKSSEEYLDAMLTIMKDYSSPCRVWLGSKLVVLIDDADHIKILLQSCLDKNGMYKFFEPIFGKGLLTASASKSAIHRKIMAPCFNTNMLRDIFDIFVEKSLTFVDELDKINLNDNEIELFYLINKCTLEIILDTAMSVKKEQSDKSKRYQEEFERFKKFLTYRLRNVFLFIDIIFKFSPTGWRQRKSINILHSIVDEIIQEKIWTLNKLKTTETKSEVMPRKVFLDILMEASYNEDNDNKKLTYENIHDEINTIIVGGSDTTAITINNVIFILANFPEIQEKVYKELSEIYGTKSPRSAPIKYEDLQYMNYLERVIKETMRFFPPVPLIGRYVTDDLKLGEFTVPKGTDVIVGVLNTHRSEKYWSNPLKFEPDRFLPENSANRHAYCYIPFSIGSRSCIGTKYAMTSMKVMLATLIRTFVFQVDKSIELDHIKLNMQLTLSTIEPLRVKIRKRNFQQDNVEIS